MEREGIDMTKDERINRALAERESTIAKQAEEIEALKAEVYKLESKLRKWYHKSRMWFDGESWVELHSAAQVKLKREESGKKLKEYESVVKMLANTRLWSIELNRVWHQEIPDVEHAFKKLVEAARQEAKTKSSVTKNNADLKRRKGHVYGPSHICYCGVSVGSCQCPKEDR